MQLTQMIDKGYLMGYAVEQGKVVVNSNLYSGSYNYTIDDCFNLANPTGKPCTFGSSTNENTYFISEQELADYQLEIKSKTNHPRTITLFNKIIRSGATNIALDTKATLNFDSNRLIAEMIVNDLNVHNTTELAPDMLDLSIKNKTLFKILQTMDDVENLPMASTSVDTVTKDPKALAGKTEAANEKKILCYDNPASIFEMQITNMVGKEVIGIAAVSLKSFFAESAYFNQLVTEIEEDLVAVNSSNKEACDALLAKMKKLTIPNALAGNSNSVLANVNYNRLYNIAQQKDILFGNEVDALIGTTFYNPLTNNTFNWSPDENGFYHLKDLVKILKFISEVNDACYGDSGLLSLATDFLR